MFTVLGATGNTGSVVANELLARGKQVRVLVRNAEKAESLRQKGAEVVVGEVTDVASVRHALQGTEGAYLLVPPDMGSSDLLGRGRRIVDVYAQALSTSPVPHVAFLSSVGAQVPKGTGPILITHEAERTLGKVSGVTFTFIRAAYFMENILANAHPMRADGVLPVFGGGESHPFPMVATNDVGRTAVEALLSRPATTEIIELSGPKEYSLVDAAAAATRILGRQVTAIALPIENMVPTLTGFGISENVAGLYREMVQALGTGLIRFDGTGRPVRGTVTLEQVLGGLRA